MFPKARYPALMYELRPLGNELTKMQF